MPALLRPCLVLMAVLTIITGVLYPLVVTVTAQAVFPRQAAGSLVEENGHVIGSALIGQAADGPGWFWPRPSACTWNASSSSGANLAPVTPPQIQAWRDRATVLRAGGLTGTLPADLVTSSGSGLDPHLSPAAALAQVPRIAAARQLDPQRVQDLVRGLVEGPDLGLLGSPRVAVLALNRGLLTLRSGAP
jgi:potassium-transporting ATPase KdpC subunit